jgi:deoxycytidine triphosphate deaminase
MLNDAYLRVALRDGLLVIDPLCEELIQPASIDLGLGRSFRRFTNNQHTHIDPSIRQDGITELVARAGRLDDVGAVRRRRQRHPHEDDPSWTERVLT